MGVSFTILNFAILFFNLPSLSGLEKARVQENFSIKSNQI